jgi:hypothetical protein
MISKKNRLAGFVADSYFASAQILLTTLNDYVVDNKSLDGLINSPHHLLYPAIFNFKNGTELWLKNLQLIIIGESDKNSHDLLRLIRSLNDAILATSHKNKDVILSKLQIIKERVLAYHNGSYLGADGKKPDTKNEAERYPEAKKDNVYCPVDYLSFQAADHEKVKNITIKTIKDVELIKQEIMSVFFNFIDNKDSKLNI